MIVTLLVTLVITVLKKDVMIVKLQDSYTITNVSKNVHQDIGNKSSQKENVKLVTPLVKNVTVLLITLV